MKKELKKKQMELKLLKPEEMLLIRAGGKKPDDPNSPDEVVIFL